MKFDMQSPLNDPAHVYLALAQSRPVNGEVRPRYNDFSSFIGSRVRSSRHNPAGRLVGQLANLTKTQV
jgi:hypothetical protein